MLVETRTFRAGLRYLIKAHILHGALQYHQEATRNVLVNSSGYQVLIPITSLLGEVVHPLVHPQLNQNHSHQLCLPDLTERAENGIGATVVERNPYLRQNGTRISVRIEFRYHRPRRVSRPRGS